MTAGVPEWESDPNTEGMSPVQSFASKALPVPPGTPCRPRSVSLSESEFVFHLRDHLQDVERLKQQLALLQAMMNELLTENQNLKERFRDFELGRSVE